MAFQDLHGIEHALEWNQVPIRALHEIWQQRTKVPEPAAHKAGTADGSQIPWIQSDFELCLRFIDHAFAGQEFLLLCDAAREILRYWESREGKNPDLLRVRMRLASALTHLGHTQTASRELEQCLSATTGPSPTRATQAEMLRQLGDIHREEAHQAQNRAAAVEAIEAGLKCYEGALAKLDAAPLTDTAGLRKLESLVWIAAGTINAAGMDRTRRDIGVTRAQQILDLAANLEGSGGTRFETVRARAEALVLLRREDEARRAYEELRSAQGATTPSLAEVRYRTGFLADALNQPRDFLKSAFPPLQLIVFQGHLPDLPRDPPRFPLDQVEPVRQRLREKLVEMNAQIGIASAAAGGDLLFLDELGKRSGALYHVVLPWSESEFLQTSVRPFEPSAGPSMWEPLFKEATEKAATLRQLGEFYPPSQESNIGWQYMLEVQAGLALQTARVLRLDVQPLVLWDERPGRGPGGTADFVEFWEQKLGKERCVLKMPHADSGATVSKTSGSARRAERRVLRQEVKTMLFADIVGYSKFKEKAIPNFVTAFLDRVSQLAATSRHAPESVSTWGDAIYAVFDFAVDAGNFALELTQLIHDNRREWEQLDLYWEEPAVDGRPALRQPLNIRVGLHTGPVFQHYNPLVRQLGFTGAHVSRAARIEPITQRGEVFASEEFAALVEMDAEMRRHGDESETELAESNSPKKRHRDETDPAAFVCEYAGSMPLAKEYPGLYRIYRLVPTGRLDIEELARAIHELYCEHEIKVGNSPEENPMLRPWRELSENAREANREQAADIPYKLRVLGYELTRRGGVDPTAIELDPERVEEMAKQEHVRWMTERQRNGWTYAPVRNNELKHHPLIVDWSELPESEKEKDRNPVRNVPALVARAGLLLRKIR